MTTGERTGCALAALVALLFSFPNTGHAQRPISLGIGAGVGVGHTGHGADGRHAHGLAFLEVKPPLIPLGARADGFIIGQTGDAGAIGYAVSAVASLPLPVLTPYALAGWGRYGVTEDDAASGWHAGFGLRFALAGSGLFAEVKRHERLGRNLLTIGMRF